MPESRKEYVDIDKTISNLMGRKNLLAKIARIYIRDYQNQMDQLQKSIDREDDEEIEKAAHKVKGSLSNFSAPEAFNMIQSIESKAEKDNLAGLEEDYKEFEKVMEDIAGTLKSFIEENE